MSLSSLAPQRALTLSGAQGSSQKDGALARRDLPRLLTPPYLREGSESPHEQQSKHWVEGAHPEPGWGAGYAHSPRPPRQPGKHAAPTCSASHPEPRLGRSWSRQSSLAYPAGRPTTSCEVASRAVPSAAFNPLSFPLPIRGKAHSLTQKCLEKEKKKHK